MQELWVLASKQIICYSCCIVVREFVRPINDRFIRVLETQELEFRIHQEGNIDIVLSIKEVNFVIVYGSIHLIFWYYIRARLNVFE